MFFYVFIGHDTAEIDPNKKSYRPLYLDHFDKKDAAAAAGSRGNSNNNGKDSKDLQQRDPEISNRENSPPNLYPPLVSHYSSRCLLLFNFLTLWLRDLTTFGEVCFIKITNKTEAQFDG